MRIRTDDRATRVEFTFYDLPGEARWFQWVRFYVACLFGIPLVSMLLWFVGSLVASGPWLVIISGLLGTVITVAVVVSVLTVTGRYETPATPLSYRWHQLKAELRAPRTPVAENGETQTLPSWEPVESAAPIYAPATFGGSDEFVNETTDLASFHS